MTIPRETIDAIRDATDIVEVVSRRVSLSRAGNSYKGLCPFHDERTPSFHVVPNKQIYHCFGCQASGDVFRFLMELEGLGFVDAVKELAGPAGITIEERKLDPRDLERLRHRATLYDVLEEAASWFEANLWTRPEGQIARDYLLGKRAMSDETCRNARLGWAPEGWTGLLDHLQQQGFDPRLALEAGLAKRNEGRNSSYDTFRARVMIPIRDDRGRIIAFGGRLLEGDGPKYINSPETPIYEKSKVLYALDAARRDIQRKERMFVVEGYFDVLAMHQFGFGETVATCGTALTPDHLSRIRRLTRDVVLLMDSDEAGLRAAERSLPLFLDAGIKPWRLELPGAKDPDELLREEGPEALEAAMAHREPLVEWVIRRRIRARGRDGVGRQQALEDVLPLLERMPEVVRSDQIRIIADILGIDERVLRQRLATARQRGPQDEQVRQAPTGWRPVREIVHVLWLLVHRYDLTADLFASADPSLFAEHGPVTPVIARLLTGEPVSAILPEVEDPGVARALAAVVARQELYPEEKAAWGAREILVELVRPRLEIVGRDLKDQARQALERQDWEAYRNAQGQVQEFGRQNEVIATAMLDRDAEAWSEGLSRALAFLR